MAQRLPTLLVPDLPITAGTTPYIAAYQKTQREKRIGENV